MIVNLNQTSSKSVQSLHHTMEKKGIVNVGIVGSGDKRLITATFALTYNGETTKSIPPAYFQFSFSFRANPKHFPKADKSVKIIKEILFQYLNH